MRLIKIKTHPTGRCSPADCQLDPSKFRAKGDISDDPAVDHDETDQNLPVARLAVAAVIMNWGIASRVFK
jgi:hypothetical protein